MLFGGAGNGGANGHAGGDASLAGDGYNGYNDKDSAEDFTIGGWASKTPGFRV